MKITDKDEKGFETGKILFAGNEEAYIKYASFGKGSRNLLYLPGVSLKSTVDTADMLTRTYRDFLEDFRITVLDRKVPFDEKCSIASMTEDIISVLPELGISETDVFGFSQGAALAQLLAAGYPEMVRSLVLGSPMGIRHPVFLKNSCSWRDLARDRERKKLAESLYELVWSQRKAVIPVKLLIRLMEHVTDEELDHFSKMAEAAFKYEDSLSGGDIRCPVFVIGAEGDRVIPSVCFRELADRYGAELFLYDESFGHAVNDDAEDYYGRILEFLKKHP